MKRTAAHRIYILLAMVCIFIASCTNDLLFEAGRTLPDRSWSADNKISFAIEVTDTLSKHDIYLNIRNTDTYKFSNLYVFLETQIPDGSKDLDTLECILADDHGKWKGDGLGDLFDNRILFAHNVRFTQAGKYTFTFTQGMRINPLQGISDFGIRIVNNK